MKTCVKCLQAKPLDQFCKYNRAKDGHHHRCRACVSLYQTSEPVKEARRRRRKLQLQTDPNNRHAEQKRYRQSEAGKVTLRRHRKLHKARYPEKERAHRAVHKAISSGRMLPARQRICDHCGQPSTAYHHYKGYASEHRLDVIPLCTRCHTEADKKQ